MKKIIAIFLMGAIALTAFAQNRDSTTVWHWNGTANTSSVVYHLEVWDQHGRTTDVNQFISKLDDLRKYSSVGFFIHANNGYIVTLYASPSWDPQLTLPAGVTSIYSLATQQKAIISTNLKDTNFRKLITRSSFLDDLTTVYNGLR
jgi:hypothetical protein